jgi:lipid kinase YegS
MDRDAGRPYGRTAPLMAEPAGSLIVLHGEHGSRRDVRDAVEEFRAEGHDIEVRSTWERGHAALFAAEAADAGRRVVAAGGDGTVNEVAEALVARRSDVTLAVLPLGTANDFATAAGIPVGDVRAALELALDTGIETPVDVLRWDDRVVVNLATAGPATRVTVETPDGLKRALGGLSYAVSGIARLAGLEGRSGVVRGPDFEWEGRFLALAFGNGRQAGGGVVLCPEARIDDGLLDLRIVPEGEGAGALLLESLLHGREAVLEDASIGRRLSWVEVETPTPLHVNLDGEPAEGARIRFEVEPAALPMVLPEGSPLLTSSGSDTHGPAGSR